MAYADFPAGATVDQVSDETIWRLGAYYVPTILALWMGMIGMISMYRLSEATHEANLQELANRRRTSAAST